MVMSLLTGGASFWGADLTETVILVAIFDYISSIVQNGANLTLDHIGFDSLVDK